MLEFASFQSQSDTASAFNTATSRMAVLGILVHQRIGSAVDPDMFKVMSESVDCWLCDIRKTFTKTGANRSNTQDLEDVPDREGTQSVAKNPALYVLDARNSYYSQ